MAAIAGELSKQIKGHSEGAQGFRPWWDTVEDNLLYAFVILGLVTLPMTFFSKTPIECTPHPRLWPAHGEDQTEGAPVSRFFPKVFCTEEMIEPFLLYLPFTLLLVPIILTAIEKTYVVLYKVEDKMNQFYLLLVKESLASEDVASLSKDNIRDCHEIEQAFKFSDDCYCSYFWRTLLEIIGSSALIVMFAVHNGSPGLGVRYFDCWCQKMPYECIVPNAHFFMYVYVVALILLSAYLSSSIYNFLWIVHPKVGALSKFLYGCKRQAESYSEIVQKNAAGPVINLKLYFKKEARDFSLLINLLAESQGVPEALRILALFEHQFAMLWEATNVRLTQRRRVTQALICDANKKSDEVDAPEILTKEKALQTLIVSWDDAEIAEYFIKAHKKRHCLEYTVEISPATEAPIKSILYYQDSPWLTSEELTLMSSQNGLGVSSCGVANDKDSVGKASGTSSVQSSDRGRKYSLSFDGLEPGQTYKITFSSEIDGRTIMQTIRNYECTNDDTSRW